MAELKNKQEPTFPSKRKPEDTEELPKKAPKLATLDHNETQEANTNSNDNNNSEAPSTNCSSLTEEKTESDVVPKEDGNDDNELLNDHEHDENDDDDDDDDEDEDEDDDSNDEAELDRKGKGVLRDDKGKGKLIEEDDDSDDDDSGDDDGSVSGGDSDFSDDPLAEVDLNNILPSRTRRRTPLPGVHIASDTLNADEDDDDSDDSDA